MGSFYQVKEGITTQKMARAVKFSNGMEMPLLGLGTWQFESDETLKTAINSALEAGYRSFDTAFDYENEGPIGDVLNEWIQSRRVKREELFITTKLPFIGNRADKVEKFLLMSLEELKLKYVDLFLIHFPVGLHCEDDLFPEDDSGNSVLDMNTDLVALWQAMEAQVDAGRCKAIGVSNFNSKQLQRIVQAARIKPACLQVEVHAYFQQKPLRELCSQLGISVCAYGTLGSKGRIDFCHEYGTPQISIPAVLENQTVADIAKALRRSESKRISRFMIQQNVVVVPKSSSEIRIKENIKVYDFVLSTQEMESLNSLDQNLRSFTYGFLKGIESHPEYPFKIPY